VKAERLLRELLGDWKPRIVTIHLPPPPENRYIWFGCVGVLYYAN